MKLKGKVVLITGGSGGIGKALALAFANQGADISICGRDPEALEKTAAEIRIKGVKVLSVPADVGVKEDCERFIQESLKTFGRIDILINNAGMSMRALFKDANLDVIERLMQVNFWGMVYCTHYALESLLKSKGTIIGISSIAGHRGLPARTGYSASKFAMNGFLEALRTELLYTGVSVLTVSPGFTQSNIRNTALSGDGKPQKESPLAENKIMSAEEVAEAIVKATLNKKRSLVLTRQGKLTVTLNKILPGWMDKMVYKHFAAEPDSPLPKR